MAPSNHGLHRVALLWTVWFWFMISIISLLLFNYIECSKLARAHDRHTHGSSKKHHSSKHDDSDSDEDDTTASPPQAIGLKGLASAGISHIRNTLTIPKCLGQDMRLEKLIQVTQFCEGETHETAKNETVGMGKSLCFTACLYKYLGLIGDDLMFTSNIDTVVVDIFPSIAHIMVKKAMRSCAKQSVLPLSKSDNCTSFGPVKGCILRNVNNICSGDY